MDAVEALDLRQAQVNARGTGDEHSPPAMRLARLIYRSAAGTFGSRRIGQSPDDNVAVRLLTADPHPDPDPIGTFGRENPARLNESFVKVLPMAPQVKGLKFRADPRQR